MRIGTFAAALLLPLISLFAGTASAADLSYPTQQQPAPFYAPTSAFSWTGFYLGLNAGGGWGHEDCTSCNPGANDFSLGGPFAGIQGGYNWQANRIVLGVETDLVWSGIDGACNGTTACNGPPQLTTQDLDWFGTFRGRLGWATNNNLMPYITGGLAYGRGTRNTSSGGGDTATASHLGWTAGVGLEYAVNQSWSAKIEYQYMDLGAAHYDFPNIGGPNPDVSLTSHTLRVGINRHF